ncbi:initiation factor 2 [Piedraia hortae CBS 480.64]|uniref:Translation initiation factor IF-2, mitochondrial n=1 Tax=Piedraia hortae CBS 480.64 TaxID=1314780 RepID=A0A6A7C9D3_9PEZI|nr:initiation factor 2 [Piedraia hortae CBS 480.64]
MRRICLPCKRSFATSSKLRLEEERQNAIQQAQRRRVRPIAELLGLGGERRGNASPKNDAQTRRETPQKDTPRNDTFRRDSSQRVAPQRAAPRWTPPPRVPIKKPVFGGKSDGGGFSFPSTGAWGSGAGVKSLVEEGEVDAKDKKVPLTDEEIEQRFREHVKERGDYGDGVRRRIELGSVVVNKDRKGGVKKGESKGLHSDQNEELKEPKQSADVTRLVQTPKMAVEKTGEEATASLEQPKEPSQQENIAAEPDKSAARQHVRQETVQRRPRWAVNDDDEPRKSKRGRPQHDEDDDMQTVRQKRAARKAAKRAQREQNDKTEKSKLHLPEFIDVARLAQMMGVHYESFTRRLQRLGYDDIFPGMVLNSETSGLIAMEYDFEPVFEADSEDSDKDLKAQPALDDTSSLPARPPVVTIMGHVDHGKTTILDYLRKSSVAAGEAGGITQHIGAFSVPLANSAKTITFLDTPGHAAFLAMRQRGANVTDIVVLVVAADDSVKPQTLEALKHARNANVPIIVAVNKIDKDGADLEKVKSDLSRHSVEIEDYGGDVQVVPVSGKTGQGMDSLEESIVTLSEILDHRASATGSVEGWVLEASTKKFGRVATILIRRGTLKVGSILVAGRTWARVRSLRNESGASLTSVTPGFPVEVDGWRDQPTAGDEVLQASSEHHATSVVSYREKLFSRRKSEKDIEAINTSRRQALAKEEEEENIPPIPQQGQITVPLVLKTDVSGSCEAITPYLHTLTTPLIKPLILRTGIGGITPSDIDFASASRAHILTFNLPVPESTKASAKRANVPILSSNIIYHLRDQLRELMESLLPEIEIKRVVGEAEVCQVFDIAVAGKKKIRIAGCKVRNGSIRINCPVRVVRGQEEVTETRVASLKNVKKDVEEMKKGSECGVAVEGFEGFEVGDVIQMLEVGRERRRVDI